MVAHFPWRLLLVLNTHVEDLYFAEDVAHEQYCALACSVSPASLLAMRYYLPKPELVSGAWKSPSVVRTN
jgi:hypothetical protein